MVRGSASDADEPENDTPGMRFVFWAWMTILVGGLVFMTVTGLVGR